VPLIIQLYILAPFLIQLALRRARLLIVLTLILQISVQVLKYLDLLGYDLADSESLRTYTASWFFPGHIFWFVFGIIIKFRLSTFKIWLKGYRWVLAGILVTLIPIGVMEWEAILGYSQFDWLASQPTLIDDLYAFIFLLCFLAFENFPFPHNKQINKVGAKSYGIYLVHSPVLEYTSRGIYHVLPWLLGVQIIFQPILVLLGIGLPLLLMKFVDRSPARRFYSYIFG
jgi:peptidoglycan/LPS O-acetylase OafA/YrhL